MPLWHNGRLHRRPFFNYINGVTYVNSLDSVVYSGSQFVPETKTVILECIGPQNDKFTLECVNSLHGVKVIMGAVGAQNSEPMSGIQRVHTSTGLVFDGLRGEVKQLVHGVTGGKSKLCFQNADVVLDFSQDEAIRIVSVVQKQSGDRTSFFSGGVYHI